MRGHDSRTFSRRRTKVSEGITLCCWPPGPLARRGRRAYPQRYVRSEHKAGGPAGRTRRGAAVKGAYRLCCRSSTMHPASPASRRLASVRPALAPKSTGNSFTDPKGPNHGLHAPGVFRQRPESNAGNDRLLLRTTSCDRAFPPRRAGDRATVQETNFGRCAGLHGGLFLESGRPYTSRHSKLGNDLRVLRCLNHSEGARV